jgi:hypothetical protein
MKTIVTFMLCFPFFLWFLFQPFYNEITHLRGMAIEQTLNYGLQQAAVNGGFTSADIQRMRDTLSNVGFDPNALTFSGTLATPPLARGNTIRGTLTYPMSDLWALPGIFGRADAGDRYVRSGSMMSEYIAR